MLLVTARRTVKNYTNSLLSSSRSPTRTVPSRPSWLPICSPTNISTKRLQSTTMNERELFTYTSGRYLYNENLRFAERHVKFNVDALKTAAARCVDRQSVTRIRKLAEGGFNRVFILTMDDGFEVIAKIPYLLTVPKKLTTESEVATMDFLRSNGIPVPKVYAYSSNENNEIGTEYIIMEKAAGKPLTETWFELNYKEQLQLVTSYVNIERKLFSFSFGAYGSLYYRESLPQSLQADLYSPGTAEGQHLNDKFCIGPLADYMFWRGRHAELDIYRGPCKYL